MPARSRRRSLRRNPLSPQQKLLGVGGALAIGGVAAYALMRSSEQAPTTPPSGSTGQSLADQCAALRNGLIQMRAQPNPDRSAMARLEAQIASCIEQARAAGGEVDNATSNLSTGDTAFQQIENWFGEYRATDYSDALKRNNIRKNMIETGEAMARAYAEAVPQAPDALVARTMRQSIIRALTSAMARRACYLYDQRGCGRLGVNEDHGNDKAAQEQARVINPLLAAQAAAVQRLRSLGGTQLVAADNAAYFAALMIPATAASEFINAKFNEYKATDYSDALKRNNLRQEILAAGRAMTAALQYAVGETNQLSDTTSLQSIAAFIIAALGSANGRWLCFILDQPGCGRLGVNEDHGNDKAGQESAATIAPLSALYMDVARRLVSSGMNLTAFEPLIATKLRRCTTISDFVNAKFNEYKATDYSDALKRNNLRQVVLYFGGQLAACLRDAMDSAISGASARPTILTTAATSAAVTAATRGAGLFINILPSGTSGLGVASLTAAPATKNPTSLTIAPQPSNQQFQAAIDAGIRTVKSVMGPAKTALDAAIGRQLCYLYDQPGCGRLGVNEDHGNDKASQEQATTVTPLLSVVTNGTNFLVGANDPQAEVALITAKLRYCTAMSDYVNAKFNEYKSVSWSDAVRRNNLRQEVLGKGRDMVRCFAALAPRTPVGRNLVKKSVDAALASSRARVACYNDSSSQCGRFGWNEDDNATKAAQETADITTPLATLSSQIGSQPLAGWEDMEVGAGIAGAVLAIGGVVWLSKWMTGAKRKVAKNRRQSPRRRTSRRVSA